MKTKAILLISLLVGVIGGGLAISRVLQNIESMPLQMLLIGLISFSSVLLFAIAVKFTNVRYK